MKKELHSLHKNSRLLSYRRLLTLLLLKIMITTNILPYFESMQKTYNLYMKADSYVRLDAYISS
ncbi:hypothetical protein KORDIASMS9_03398 [Kordia sp. SMS9]|nr:hypothetical protein KORDIASMS9_03398 [Kordia sp. SMS9]